METNVKEQKQKRGLWAAIWESMTKTGGCCGSGGNCSARPSRTTTNRRKWLSKTLPGALKDEQQARTGWLTI